MSNKSGTEIISTQEGGGALNGAESFHLVGGG